MEGEDQKQFICRYCSKRYPCGKSLGGHLRSHRTAKDRTQIENVVSPKPKLSPPLDHNAYVLRENPKKTWRLADSRSGGHHLERFCKECGKGFQSMKAMCGHMACHSDKDKAATMSRKFSVEEKEVQDSQSDTETMSGPRRGKRSKRLRYKTLDFNSNPSMFLSVANGSSSVSEIEQEQEEVAMCLMMLSRDCCHGKGLNSFAECSDNSSVVLEAKSSSIDMKNKIGFAQNLNSGFERGCGFNNLKGKSKSRFESLKAELGKRGSNKQLKQINADHSMSYGPIRESCSEMIKDHELWEICHKKIENGTALVDESCKIARKRSEFQGFTGLNSKIKFNGCYDSICESGENSIEADSFSSKAKVNKSSNTKAKKRLGAKNSKGHECPICFREFKSGQALGGHKRSHFIGGPDDRTLVFIARQEVHGMLDLNLPAPGEEEDTPGSWQGRLGGSTSMSRQVGLR